LAKQQQLVARVQAVVVMSVRVVIVAVAEIVVEAVIVAVAVSAEAADVVTHNIHERKLN
jgi:hypothetical protein